MPLNIYITEEKENKAYWYTHRLVPAEVSEVIGLFFLFLSSLIDLYIYIYIHLKKQLITTLSFPQSGPSDVLQSKIMIMWNKEVTLVLKPQE